jgi:predicted CoA-substrate-specific enzyme activase
MDVYLGIDIGSVSVKVVVMDEERNILEDNYVRSRGEALIVLEKILKKIIHKYSIKGIATTGTGGRIIAKLLGAKFVNEIIAQGKATAYFYPEVRAIIEIGGEDSKLILINKNDIEDFIMNTICAAGTGSFLDQQANRLGLSIEEFSELALKSTDPPRIAGRCSVFAKSDMIHFQQIATPDYDIVAGLCYAVARNFKSNIKKTVNRPISFQGGVAANLGMRKAFKDIFGLDNDEFIIPKYFASMGAIGAVLVILEDSKFESRFRGLDKLIKFINRAPIKVKGLEPLSSPKTEKKIENIFILPSGNKKIDAFLGIDVGSISTNLVVIDKVGRIISKRYLMTAGRPIEAIRTGLKEIGDEVGKYVNIRGVGTTGSGRYLTGDFVGADIIRNEITAQAVAALSIDPDVDTIFEIGGQDSKYISLKDGIIVDFEMNKVCAAGTGSFLEEQAERLGISIKDEFGDLALGSKNPLPLGEKCTVFMESNIIHHQQRGASKDELVAGLCYSIVQNYLNRVVGDKKIGDRIFFQGGVAFNRGVVAAFEKILGKKIRVPDNHEVTGAIGAALLSAKLNRENSNFKGFELSDKNYYINTFKCGECSNDCEIRMVKVEYEEPLYYGSRCEKYDFTKRRKKRTDIPDLFLERENLLFRSMNHVPISEPPELIGIPRILFFHELYPFWQTFFTSLGFKVILSDKTSKDIINSGVEKVLAEPCFPIKVSYGHICNLIKKGVNRIFIPSIINIDNSLLCPYVQSFPYVVSSAIDFKDIQLLKPVINMDFKGKGLKRSIMSFANELKRNKKSIERAIEDGIEAQRKFYNNIKRKGEEILGGVKNVAVVIVGRPYNGCDQGINLGLPKKLKDLGILSIPIDFLPIEKVDLGMEEELMYWRFGKQILKAATIIRDNPKLVGIYITNFGCGPDSFISTFFKERLKGKPFLQLEIDEHSADAGVLTRIEAFLDSIGL